MAQLSASKCGVSNIQASLFRHLLQDKVSVSAENNSIYLVMFYFRSLKCFSPDIIVYHLNRPNISEIQTGN